MKARNRPIEIENCDWTDSVLAYASGTQSEVAPQEIERHLSSCAICRGMVSDYIKLVSPAMTKEEEQILDKVEPSVIRSASELLRRRRSPDLTHSRVKAGPLRWWIPATATLVLASALVFFLIPTRQPKLSAFERGKEAYALSLSRNRVLTYRVSGAPYAPYLAVRGEAERRQLKAAKVLFEAALAERPAPEVKQAIGRVMLEERDASAALAILNQALAEKPGDPELRSDRAVAMAETGNVGGALEELDAILNETPGQPTALFNRAIINFGIGKTDQAEKDAGRLATIEPDSPWTAELRNRSKNQ
jgi:tetratricopeptide (TPR) repeat protein